MSCRTATYRSSDGLELFYRDYPGPDPQALTVVCLPGLSRNSRDFEPLAEHLSDRYRVITPDLRGRGLSQWDPQPERYRPPTYVADLWELLDHLQISEVAVVGTSLGGLMAMIMASQQPKRLRGVVLNDIGPEIAPEGIERIRQYVGRQPAVATWAEAAAQARTIYASAFPDYDDEHWDRFARRTYRELPEGGLRIDMDPAIGDAARRTTSEPTDLWPLFDALNVPVLVIHGALSDILVESTLNAMRRRKPDLEIVTIENRGHAPQLDEPEAMAAIDRFLDGLPVTFG